MEQLPPHPHFYSLLGSQNLDLSLSEPNHFIIKPIKPVIHTRVMRIATYDLKADHDITSMGT